MKTLIPIACTFAALAMSCGVASAQSTYPTKPIRLIIAFEPGGSTDIVGRIVAQALSERLGKAVIIDNRGGGGGIVGTEMAARAEPDGHTITLGTTSTHVISPVSHTNISYDPMRDFAPITMVASVPYLLALHPGVAAKSLKEFVALAKAQPGKFNYASAGTGSLSHLAGEMLKTTVGIDAVHVPYKGGGPATTAMVTGESHFTLNGLAALLPHVKAGRMRAIAMSTPKRSAELPEVPTVAESGYPGFEVWVWQAFFAPKGTPPAIVSRLQREVTAITQSPDIVEGFKRSGVEVATSTPAELSTVMKKDLDRYSKAIKAAGIRLN